MKKVLSIVTLVLLIACNNDPRAKLPQTGNFGATVTADSAITVNDLLVTMGTQTEANVKVTGLVESYCKGEGCWLTLKNPSGDALFVEIEEKAFVLPHKIDGKVAVVQGKAVKEDIEGKTQVKILANGVLIK